MARRGRARKRPILSVWRDAVAAASDLDPEAKIVALAISCFMDSSGQGEASDEQVARKVDELLRAVGARGKIDDHAVRAVREHVRREYEGARSGARDD